MMKTRRAVFLVFILTAFYGLLGAEEEVEHFILPETPPTIERVKNPPLDRPYLRKQDFAPEFDLSPATLFLNLKFRNIQPRANPLSAGVYAGSFGARGGNFAYTSTGSVNASFREESEEGERPNLAAERTSFDLRSETGDSTKGIFSGEADGGENTVWLQRQDRYGVVAGYSWYLRENLSAKAGAVCEKGEVKGDDSNEAVSGRFSLSWQPFEGHNASVSVEPGRDTALGGGEVFNRADIGYDLMLFSKVVVGGGLRYTKDKLFGSGRLAAGLAPGLKLSVDYRPGIEKIDWNSLYFGGARVIVNRNLLYPESVYNFNEKLSYYSGPDNFVEIGASQAHWKNFIIWDSVAGTDSITPLNAGDVYVPAGRFNAGFAFKHLSGRFGAERNLDESLTFTPDYRFSAALALSLGTWSFASGYGYTGPVSYSVGGGVTAKLGAYGNLSVTVKKLLAPEVELYVSLDNALSEKIETQPGLVSTAPSLYAGLNMKL